jgi:hypothetical protein
MAHIPRRAALLRRAEQVASGVGNLVALRVRPVGVVEAGQRAQVGCVNAGGTIHHQQQGGDSSARPYPESCAVSMRLIHRDRSKEVFFIMCARLRDSGKTEAGAWQHRKNS